MNSGMLMRAMLHSSRASFLMLAPVCVLLGAATATATTGGISWPLLALVLLCGVLGHASVNLLNEYLDFRSGLDFRTCRTAFSGGSGFLPANPSAAPLVLVLGVGSLLLVCLAGLYLVWLRGPGLLLPGLLGVLLVLTYTSHLNHQPVLCWVAPGLGFAVALVLGSHYVLAGRYGASVWMAALVVFVLVNNLLLLNQFPDIEADRSVGRRHLLTEFGPGPSAVVYGLTSCCVPLVVLVAVWQQLWSPWALLALLPWSLTLVSLRGALRHGADLGSHGQPLASNVIAVLATPSVLALVIWLNG